LNKGIWLVGTGVAFYFDSYFLFTGSLNKGSGAKMKDLSKLVNELDDKSNPFMNEDADVSGDMSVEDFNVLQQFRKENNYNTFIENLNQ
jgi:hypothetical protein